MYLSVFVDDMMSIFREDLPIIHIKTAIDSNDSNLYGILINLQLEGATLTNHTIEMLKGTYAFKREQNEFVKVFVNDEGFLSVKFDFMEVRED